MKRAIWENPVTRRQFFRDAGLGGVGLGMALFAYDTRSARAQTMSGRGAAGDVGHNVLALGGSSNGNVQGMQLPFWSNGALWNEEEYFSTIQAHRRMGNKTYQSSDVDGDGQDELIGRCAGGILVVKFDAATGQWIDLPDGPGLSDAAGWNAPSHYETIQCADLDGDGQAEIIARGFSTESDPRNVLAWRYDNKPSSPTYRQWVKLAPGPMLADRYGWNAPEYYETMHCADIDGDGRAEVLIRDIDGVLIYQYDGVSDSWTGIDAGPNWSDAGGWNQPKYYETIQCADIDGDGQAELLGRNAAEMEVWKYHPATYDWHALASCPGWGDADGFTDPTKYGTIQCADIDGDGACELLGRGANGIMAAKYDPKANVWNFLPPGPGWSDAPGGWNKLPYTATIQCADLDGDGKAELFARNAAQIEVWSYDPQARQWKSLPPGPNWGDAQGWGVVEQYSTIQTAKIRPLTGSPNTQYALVGRGPLSMQTFRFDPSSLQGTSASAPFPSFTTGQLAAYQYLSQALGSVQPIRERYGDGSGVLNQWTQQIPTIANPGQFTPADWNFVTGQILNEVRWAVLVQTWYAVNTANLITDTFLGKDLTLQTIGDYMSIPGDDPTKFALSIAGTVGNCIRALFSFFPWPISIIGAVGGAVSTGITAAQTFMPNGGNAYQVTYAQLGADLANSFSAILTANDNNLALITGTTKGNTFIPGDYGLLAAIGTQIQQGTWAWPEDIGTVVSTMQRGYATSVWQKLAVAKWQINMPPQSEFPIQYTFEGKYIENSNSTSFPIAATLSALFDSNTGGAPFPLGVPLKDVYDGENGWNLPKTFGSSFNGEKPEIRLGADIRTTRLTLSRDPVTNEAVIAVTLHNHGLTAATNLAFSSAEIRRRGALTGQKARAIHIRPYLRIGAGTSRTVRFRFNTESTAKGSLFRVAGRYKGGSFGFTLTLPAG